MSSSETRTLRPGRIRNALTRILKRLTETESQITVCPGPAPMSGATRSPMVCGIGYQSAPFQLRISPCPHSCSTIRVTPAMVRRGSAPSELPSK